MKKMTSQQSKRIRQIEEKWKSNSYRKVDDILADYKFLTNHLPSELCSYIVSKSKAVADIIQCVQKYNQYM